MGTRLEAPAELCTLRLLEAPPWPPSQAYSPITSAFRSGRSTACSWRRGHDEISTFHPGRSAGSRPGVNAGGHDVTPSLGPQRHWRSNPRPSAAERVRGCIRRVLYSCGRSGGRPFEMHTGNHPRSLQSTADMAAQDVPSSARAWTRTPARPVGGELCLARNRAHRASSSKRRAASTCSSLREITTNAPPQSQHSRSSLVLIQLRASPGSR